MTVKNYKPIIKAITTEEKYLAEIGVPSEYWKLLLKDFSFITTPFRKGKLSLVAQKRWCESLVIEPPYCPIFIIGSYPTDRGAVALASWMLRHRLSRDKRILFATAGMEINYRRTYTTICIQNVAQEATPKRCEEVKDLVLAYDNAFRVIAVATKTPEAWSLNKIHLKPTAVFKVKDL